MAKQPDKKPAAPKAAAKPKEPKADKAPARSREVLVRAEVKAEAAELIRKIAAADVTVREARLRREDKELGLAPDVAQKAVCDARDARAALKRDYSNLYGRAADSCQAAETEAAAGK